LGCTFFCSVKPVHARCCQFVASAVNILERLLAKQGCIDTGIHYTSTNKKING
jgi:hypothetical protein